MTTALLIACSALCGWVLGFLHGLDTRPWWWR